MHSSQHPDSKSELTAADLELLRRRAARYAARTKEDPVEVLEVVLFRRARGRYAVALEHLREIRALRAFTPIPGASRVVPGAFLYRGDILSAHDLAAFMSDDAREDPRAPWVLIAEHGDRRVGLLADEVFHVEPVQRQRVHAPPITLGNRSLGLQGVVSGELLLLDLPALLAIPAFYNAM